jgi:L-seryl-tRNA(Ser) seleniumtransferase
VRKSTRAAGSTAANVYRKIPAVDAVLRREDVRALMDVHGRPVVIESVRGIIARMRLRLGESGRQPGEAPGFLDELKGLIEEAVSRRTSSTLKRVINATGVVVHTNLGRAVLSEEARARVAMVASHYCTLEYDLVEGCRGSRSSHLERSLSFLFPDHASLAVNNNAAAVFLGLNTLADRREVIISRGEMVEIGGSFRIPDVIAKSGAILREVGTTNRTRLADYEQAIGPQTGLILKVHPSNYRIVGFTQEVDAAELAELAGRHGLKLMVDQGGGNLMDLAEAGIKNEPTVASILRRGADLVTFSGDKMLGGPQAGIVVGDRKVVELMRKSPLYRVLRLDKMTLAALEATLDAYVKGTEREELPVPRMIFATREQIGARARHLAEALRSRLGAGHEVDTVQGVSRVGGGAAPVEDLETVLVRVRPTHLARHDVVQWEDGLRGADLPVIARIQDDAILLDLRTVDPREESDLIETLAATA